MNKEHLSTIINTYQKKKAFLSSVFYRQFKSFQNSDFSIDENLHEIKDDLNEFKEVIKQLNDELLRPFYDNVEFLNNSDSTIQELYPMPNKFDFTLNLELKTNGLFKGQINKTDLDYIEGCLNEAYGKVVKELNEIEINKELQEILLQDQHNYQSKNNSNSEDFYKKIATQLYNNNYKIGNYDYVNFDVFIEAKHNESILKGELFYNSLIRVMVTLCERFADTAKDEVTTYKEKIFKKFVEYCAACLDTIKKPGVIQNVAAKKVIKNIIGYKINFKEAELEDFFNDLISNKYIDKETILNDFITFFSGKSVNNTNKIKWLGSATLLLSFIRELMDKGLIESSERMNYVRISNCFLNKDGSELNQNFKELNQGVKNELIPENKAMLVLIKRYV